MRRHAVVVAAPKTAARARYHHGDLRNALVESAVQLARAGGPTAVVLREVARRVGVSAAAAYRHFSAADDLVEAVRREALGRLAAAMARAVRAVPADGDPGDVAVARLRASAEGYLDFACSEPGLFQAAFSRPQAEGAGSDETETQFSSASFRMLGGLLDEVLAAGRMTPAARAGAEIAAWSAIHGLAMLKIQGPLRDLGDEAEASVRRETIDVLVRGLTAAG